jgi:phage terminase large subunit
MIDFHKGIAKMMTLSELKSYRDDIMRRRQSVQSKHITFLEDRTIIHAQEADKIYIPTNTGAFFHNDHSFVRLIMGPYGSGKSTLCINEIVRRTCAMPRWYKGRRRAKWAIVRNTSGELHSTTLQTWLTWFGELGDINKRQKPLLTYEHTFNDGFGVIELELIFIALDREEDLRKIKSLEVTGAYINELSEVPQGALAHFKGRVNHRYPSRSFCADPYWSGIIADTNPPDLDHWIYKDFELKALESYKIFKQPPGLLKDVNGKWFQNPNCDNSNNLASDYYTKLAEGQTEDFVKVFCLGEYGSVGFGKRVYPEFNSDVHAVDRIPAIQGDPIHLGWDFGLTPACIVVQLSPRGQVRVLKEYQGEDIGIRTFAQNIVLPSLQRDFPYNKIGISRADPSGIAGDDIMEELSCIGELNSLGIKTDPANTNDLEPRIGSVKYLLNTMIDGQPAFIVSREGAPKLIKGFIKDYIYKRISVSGEERYKEVPHKNMASHLQDSLQYIALEFAASNILATKAPVVKVDMYNPVLRIF